MKRGQKEAMVAIKEALRDRKEPMTLYSMSCLADRAARKKRQTDLFDSLFDYYPLIPPGWKTAWLSSTGSSDSMLYVVPNDWKPGGASNSLLLPGELTYAYA